MPRSTQIQLANKTGGRRLAISDIKIVEGILLAAVCRELGDDAFAELGSELRGSGNMRGAMYVIYEEVRRVRVVNTASNTSAMKALRC